MLQKLQFKPGANRETTNYTNEGGWYDMDKVRFRFGFPEKIGGWSRLGSNTFKGVARDLVHWSTLSGDNLIGVGTNTRYFIGYGEQFHNVTPVRRTATVTDPFATRAGSSIVTVTDPSHGALAGDNVSFTNAAAVGGIGANYLNVVDGYPVLSKLDVNSYTIDVGTLATSTASGGGSVSATYEMYAGLTVFSTGSGFSAGEWNGPITGDAVTALGGSSVLRLDDTSTTVTVVDTTGFAAAGTLLIESELVTYTGKTATTFTGCARGALGTRAANHAVSETAPGSYSSILVKQVVGYQGDSGWGVAADVTFGTNIQMRLWSSDAYGQDLVLAPRGGGLYYWTLDTAGFSRALPVRNGADPELRFVPHTVNAMVVSDVSRFVVALGANPYDPTEDETEFDPMLLRWSEQENPSKWIPDATNQSGEIRLSAGSFIMTGVKTKQEILVWTDTALYSMQYVGPPYVFRTELVMGNLSLMGPNAVATVNNAAFWMGVDKFYTYAGRVETLVCPLRQYIFNDLAPGQKFQTHAGTNEGFSEIWWFYVSNAEVAQAAAESRSPSCDKYVVYNHAEQIWYYGTMRRTAWLDTPMLGGPLAATGTDSQGQLVIHEQGTDDAASGSAVAIESFIESSDFDIGDGHQFMFVTRVLPDVAFNGSTVPNPEVLMSLTPRQNPGAGYGARQSGEVRSTQDYGTIPTKSYTVQQFTQQINTRVRGRQMAFRIESDGVGVSWQLGTPRIDMRPDGRKS